MRSLLAGVVVVAAACHPSPRVHAPRADRPIVSDLAISLDGADVTRDADGSSHLFGHGPTAFRITATSNLTRHPYPGEDLEAVLTSGEHVLRQLPLTVDARHARTAFDIPAPGTYRVEIWSGERYVTGNTFVAASVPATDGQRVLELHQDAAPRLFVAPGERGRIRLMHWDSIDTDTGYLAEWWRDGRRVGVAGRGRSELQQEVLLGVQTARDSLDLTAWKWATEQFALPADVRRQPGRWELRVFREHHPALAFNFDVTASGAIRGAHQGTITDGSVELLVTAADVSRAQAKAVARELARLPHRTFEASSKYALGVTVEEVRALTRSDEARRLRLRINELQRRAETSEPEMKGLVTTMKKMIGSMGEPWAEDERPRSGRRG